MAELTVFIFHQFGRSCLCICNLYVLDFLLFSSAPWTSLLSACFPLCSVLLAYLFWIGSSQVSYFSVILLFYFFSFLFLILSTQGSYADDEEMRTISTFGVRNKSNWKFQSKSEALVEAHMHAARHSVVVIPLTSYSEFYVECRLFNSTSTR